MMLHKLITRGLDMPLTLTQYWNALDASLKDFDKTNQVKAKDEKDQAAYQKQRTFLEEMLKTGLELENASCLLTKASPGHKLENLPVSTWGNDRIPTNFFGILSVTFAEKVYLPHLKRFGDTTFDNQDSTVKLLVNFSDQQKKTLALATALEEAIRQYKNASLLKQSTTLQGSTLYAPKQIPKETKEIKQTSTSPNVRFCC